MYSAATRRVRGLAIIFTVAASMLAWTTPARAAGYEASRDPASSGLAAGRVFSTSFESVGDFAGFYIVPQNYMGTTSHDLSAEQVRSGTYAHKAWIFGANPPPPPGGNTNHRGYPTVQLHKTAGGGYVCPCDVTFHVWLDMPLDDPGEWFSFATLARLASDSFWDGVLVNLSAANPAPGTAPGGVLHLMHVPSAGLREPTFQTSTILFPMRQWVEIRIYLDLDPVHGEAKVWQDGQLVSAAPVSGGNGKLEQAHFGMYAAPELASGVVYNDDLQITEAAAASVGGTAELPPADNAPRQATTSSDGNAGRLLAIAAAAASCLTILSAGAWYARRRQAR